MNICSIPGCADVFRARGFCNKHWQKWAKYGDALVSRNGPEGGGCLRPDGYRTTQINSEAKLDHVRIVESVIGSTIPDGVEIHHVDGDRANNAHSNLVVCPNHAYHMLLHRRTRAFLACGNTDWLRCTFCKKYDDKRNMYVGKNGYTAHHRGCLNLKRHKAKE